VAGLVRPHRNITNGRPKCRGQREGATHPIWDLHENRIGAVFEPGIGVGAAKIANGTIIGDIGATIGAKPHIGRPVEPADAARESLLKGLVVRKALKVQRRLT
jgi:hypothetical protein